MTYGVNGLRQLILGGIDDRLWQAIVVLIGIWAVSIVNLMPVRTTGPAVEHRPADTGDQDVAPTSGPDHDAAGGVVGYGLIGGGCIVERVAGGDR